MSELGTGKLRRQRRAARLSRREGLTLNDIFAQLIEFHLDGCEIGIDGFIEQTELIGIEPFAAAAKLPALEHCH